MREIIVGYIRGPLVPWPTTALADCPFSTVLGVLTHTQPFDSQLNVLSASSLLSPVRQLSAQVSLDES